MAVVRNPSHLRTFPLVYDLPAPRPAGRLLLSTNSIAADRAGWKLIIKRRKFITLLGGAAAARSARSGGGIPRIGVLMSKRAGDPVRSSPRSVPIGLATLAPDRSPQRAARTPVDRGHGRRHSQIRHGRPHSRGHPGIGRFGRRAVAAGDRTVPVVFMQTPDPVAAGLVANLARPGRNATGYPDRVRGLTQNGWRCSERSCRE